MRLDRFISNQTEQSKKTVRGLLAQGRVKVFDRVVRDGTFEVSLFCRVSLDDVVLQDRTAYYVMLHKPQGYLSATCDPKHPTVLDLIDEAFRNELHIGGRLDINTTGLMLLTNDGNWSRRITEPSLKKAKVYLVETQNPITNEYTRLFAKGVYLAYENLTTQPAQLEILGERKARLTIYEGRYHQVKRMFWRLENKVVALHRERMGEITLDTDLEVGGSRFLTAEEIASV